MYFMINMAKIITLDPGVGNRTFLVKIVPPGLEIGHFGQNCAPWI